MLIPEFLMKVLGMYIKTQGKEKDANKLCAYRLSAGCHIKWLFLVASKMQPETRNYG